MSNIYYISINMTNSSKEITSPSYLKVVRPLLCEHKGDATELRRLYPNFDPEVVPKDTYGLSYHLYGLPYLHLACCKNHFYAVRGLLQCGASLLRKDNKYQWTALHWASENKLWARGNNLNQQWRVDMVTWLLSEHSDARTTVNWVDKAMETPLYDAAYNGGTAIVRVLLAYGADITLKNVDGETALDIVRNGEKFTTIKVLKTAETCLKQQIVIGEWRPWKHSRFPRSYQNAMETLVVLAKTERN